MNSKFKLAAAAAAMTLSSGAFAQAVAGDILVDVYDPISHAEIAFDTGVVAGATLANTSITLSTLSGWSTFSSAVTAGGGSTSALDFILFGDQAAKAGKATIYSTDVGMVSAGSIGTASMDAPIGNLTAQITTGNNIASATSFFFASQVGLVTGYKFGGFLGASALGTESSALNVYYGSAAASVAVPTLVSTASLSSTTFTLGSSTTATPEPGSYALMVAGLLAVGAIVRRRARA